jgi:hypothetical protein
MVRLPEAMPPEQALMLLVPRDDACEVSRVISALPSTRRSCSRPRFFSPSAKAWKSHEVGKSYTHSVGYRTGSREDG